ncbi:MAG: isoleucine--tRNA ligase [Candidatus Kapabacteria bacterium]|nr:isoleucine--tRNA ligase [Candidatus Kapabacteria bacterium]
MYEEIRDRTSFNEIELKVIDFWERNSIFEKTIERRKDAKYFSFYEGPPTVNGKPGIHHLMARTLKDTVCRYKTMTGYYVRRQAGWDTHGLPVEIAVEKELGLSSKADTIKYGIENFNRKCKEFVYRNIEMEGGWRELTRRMGYWIDLNKAYITCTNDYIESVWWALKQYYDKGLIYKGFKVIPQSPTIETPLSHHELSLGYKEVRDPNCYIKLKVLKSNLKEIENGELLVWTTTPWTLLANVALAVGEDIDYVYVRNRVTTKDEEKIHNLVLAKSRLSALDGEYEVISMFKGKDLLGTEYEQIFNYEKIDKEKYPDALKVLPGDFVSTEDGSGIVHIAPAFGEDDYQMYKKFRIPFLQPVTPNGHFTQNMGEFAGRAVKTFTYNKKSDNGEEEIYVEEGCDKDIIYALKVAGKLYRSRNDYLHSYPHCWRTGNPVIYYARESWFIKSPEFKDRMIELNKEINWQPPEIGSGRFGNWLEEVKEWSLSRDRFWGTPLPIWISEDGEEQFAIGSIEELMEGIYEFPDGSKKPLKEADVEIDLHRPFVDRVIFEKNGKIFRRVPEVIDVWFDSGAMPFAQFHYPFENQELFHNSFPADYIAEGIDQTRGWFYTLHNIAVALFNKPAFKNIIVNELILDKNGVKMSKSKGNVVNPFEVMERFGADAVRWYLLVNNPPWKATLFNEDDIAKTIISDFFRSLTNIYSFFALYANIDGFTGKEKQVDISERLEIDRWVISRINTLISEYRNNLEKYDLTRAFRAVQNFVIYELSNWYIRRNRRRFWKGENDKEKLAAYQTLREVLIDVLLMMAPAAPFISEDIYQKLRNDDEPESIHLMDIPTSKKHLIDEELEHKMFIAQKIVTLTRFLREKAKIRVRQPLSRILIPVLTAQERRDIQYFESIIKEEVNIKNIEYVTGEAEIVRKKAKPNFKTIGKKFGKTTQTIADLIRNMSNSDILQLENNSKFVFKVEDNEYEITIDDVEILSEDIEGWLVASEEGLTVALDTTITDDLLSEGLAREFVNRIQNIRKSKDFDVTDRIKIEFKADDNISSRILKLSKYICNETLAETLQLNDQINGEIIEIFDENIEVLVEKVS